MSECEWKGIVTNAEEGCRIDSVISKLNNKISRTKALELIKKELVFLDGELPKASSKVKEGQEIYIKDCIIDEKDEKLVAEDIPISILYEDDDILVVNKPKGMVVHPAARELVRHTC